MQSNKARATELAKEIRDSRNRNPLERTIVDLVQLTLEAEKDKLVTAEGDDMLRAQGAVRCLQKLHKEMTEVPAHLKEKPNA